MRSDKYTILSIDTGAPTELTASAITWVKSEEKRGVCSGGGVIRRGVSRHALPSRLWAGGRTNTVVVVVVAAAQQALVGIMRGNTVECLLFHGHTHVP